MSNFGMSRPGTVDVSSSDVYIEKKIVCDFIASSSKSCLKDSTKL